MALSHRGSAWDQRHPSRAGEDPSLMLASDSVQSVAPPAVLTAREAPESREGLEFEVGRLWQLQCQNLKGGRPGCRPCGEADRRVRGRARPHETSTWRRGLPA